VSCLGYPLYASPDAIIGVDECEWLWFGENCMSCVGGTPAALRLFFRRSSRSASRAIRATAPSPSPTPSPILAPLLIPWLSGSGVVLEAADVDAAELAAAELDALEAALCNWASKMMPFMGIAYTYSVVVAEGTVDTTRDQLSVFLTDVVAVSVTVVTGTSSLFMYVMIWPWVKGDTHSPKPPTPLPPR
jgi:hypothetical protein